jgi:cell volume regulation protein A
MRIADPEPFAIGIRVTEEPEGLHHHTIAPTSPADGATLHHIETTHGIWINLLRRNGKHVPLNPDTILRAGDDIYTDTQITDRFTRDTDHTN